MRVRVSDRVRTAGQPPSLARLGELGMTRALVGVRVRVRDRVRVRVSVGVMVTVTVTLRLG